MCRRLPGRAEKSKFIYVSPQSSLEQAVLRGLTIHRSTQLERRPVIPWGFSFQSHWEHFLLLPDFKHTGCVCFCVGPHPPWNMYPKCSLNIFCCYSSSMPCHWAGYSHWFIRIIWRKLYIFLKAMKYVLLFSLIFLAIFVFVPVAVTRQWLVLGFHCYFYSLILSRFYHHQEKLFCFTRHTMSQCFLVFVIPSHLKVVPLIELMHCHTSWYLKNIKFMFNHVHIACLCVVSAVIRRGL